VTPWRDVQPPWEDRRSAVLPSFGLRAPHDPLHRQRISAHLDNAPPSVNDRRSVHEIVDLVLDREN
jgi:hypothetical protein